MSSKSLSKAVCAALALGSLASCRNEPAVTLHSYAPPGQHPNSSSAFDALLRAGRDVERTATDSLLDRTNYTPGARARALAACAAPMSRLRASFGGSFSFSFAPRDPFALPPGSRGWTLLGRCYVWRVEGALASQKYAEAVDACIQGLQFGFRLTQGDVDDALLGLTVADGVRKAIATHLGELPTPQLEALANGAASALYAKGTLAPCVAHEALNYQQDVEYVRQRVLSNDFHGLQQRLGWSVKDDLTYLEQNRNDFGIVAAVLDGLAAEAKRRIDLATSAATQPAVKRDVKSMVEVPRIGHWNDLTKQFFTSIPPLLQANDVTLARTRLLGIEALLRIRIRLTHSTPASLDTFPAALRTDPFSGRPFRYRPSGGEYRVYSVGADCQDDGGLTDAGFSTPDLTLETTDRS